MSGFISSSDSMAFPGAVRHRVKQMLLLVGVALLVTGCARTVTHTPLSALEYKAVDFSGLIPERWWADAAPPNLESMIKASLRLAASRQQLTNAFKTGDAPVVNALVLSGGSANGAFGVGVLAGWTESGTRPEFDYVTGISTGAMIAPLAFLGAGYDDELIEAYTTITKKDVYRSQGIAGVLWGSSLEDTRPLRKLIERYITPDIVLGLAAEYERGRRLSVLTTQFDALRPMVWDLTAIAANRGEEATPFIRQIILASAAVPGLFPPVAIEWTYQGKTFTELHVDGAVSAQVFAYPPHIRLTELDKKFGVSVNRRLFLIQNGNAVSYYEPAPVKTLKIMRRAISGLLLNQMNHDVERIYFISERDGVDFNMIAIPDDFEANRGSDFDPDYMRQLYELGRGLARAGDFWKTAPPTLQTGTP